jgi:hypothetical protein
LVDSTGRTWSGEEWEDYVLKLLRLHYPIGDLVEIPDRDRGDAGLEAFTSDGCAYQCYSPEEPLSVDERYVKQRDKMTRDLNKFSYGSKVGPLLGRTMIRRWLLVVPLIDSRRTVEFAQKKSVEIRDKGLPYVSDDFEVLAIMDEAFERERAELVRLGLAEVALTTSEPTPERLVEFAEAEGSLIENLDRKLSKIPALGSESPRADFVSELLSAYLRGTDALDRLRGDFPDLARPVDQVIADSRRHLVLRYRVADGVPGATLTQVVDDLANGIGQYVRGLRRADVDDIAYSATAQWLMECPLDFPDAP